MKIQCLVGQRSKGGIVSSPEGITVENLAGEFVVVPLHTVLIFFRSDGIRYLFFERSTNINNDEKVFRLSDDQVLQCLDAL